MPVNEPQKERFLDICHRCIHREGIDRLIEWLNQSDFFTAPASSRFHNSFEGGLLDHSLNVYDALCELYRLYVDRLDPISEESIAITALFHDLCKVNFYKQDTRNVKVEGVWTTVPFFSIDEKFPFGGHGSKSVFLAERFIRLTPEEAVAINCHMGFSDNEHVGSSFERFPLALLLNMADSIATFITEPGRKDGEGT